MTPIDLLNIMEWPAPLQAVGAVVMLWFAWKLLTLPAWGPAFK